MSKVKVLAVFLAAVLVSATLIAVPTWAQLGTSTQLTTNAKYERNESFFQASDGTYWLFYTRADNVGTPVHDSHDVNTDPDWDSYSIYYKTAGTITGLATATPVKIPGSRPANFCQRDVAAFQDPTGKIWVFTASGYCGSGVNYIYYYTTTDNGATWNGPIGPIQDTNSDNITGGHLDALYDNGKIWVFLEQGGTGIVATYNTADSATGWWIPVTISDTYTNAGVPKAIAGGSLDVVWTRGGNGIYLSYCTGDCTAAGNWSTTASAIALSGQFDYDPVLYKDSSGLYWLFWAPCDTTNDRQWIEVETSTDPTDPTKWSNPVRVTTGGYTGSYWWDMWPEPFEDSGNMMLFYTSEKGSSLGPGNIWVTNLSSLDVENSVSEKATTNPDTVSNPDANTDVVKSGPGTPNVTIGAYSDTPGEEPSFSAFGSFIDVFIDDPTNVNEIEVRMYYPTTILNETDLRIQWWNGTEWEDCSDQGVNTDDIAGAYGGYVWAKIRADTTPSLADLAAGAPFGAGAIASLFFFDDFEPTPPNPVWTTAVISGANLWGKRTEANVAGCNPAITPFPSTNHAWYYGQLATCDYSTGARTAAALVSPAIPARGGSLAFLNFRYFRQVEHWTGDTGPFDETYVEVRFRNAATLVWSGWQPLDWSMDSSKASESTWKSSGDVRIMIPAGNDQLQIRFVFDSVDGYYNRYIGWLIDDVIISSASAGLAITTDSLPNGAVDAAYNAGVDVTGGTTPYSWSVTGLPAGLTAQCSVRGELTSCDGNLLITGTPTEAGSFNVKVTVEDAVGHSDGRNYTLSISGAGALFFDNFESGAPGWTTAAAIGCATWDLVDDSAAIAPKHAYKSPTHAYYFHDTTTPANNYNCGTRTSEELLSPAFTVTGSNVALNFWYYRQVEYWTGSGGPYDKTWVEARFNLGGHWTSWNAVWSKDSSDPSGNDWQSSGDISIPVPTGAATMQLKFVFDSVDGFYNNFIGWMIDDVTVTGGVSGSGLTSAIPLQVNSIFNSPNPVSGAGTVFTVEGTGIKDVAVEVFNLAGAKVFDSGPVTGNTLEWNLMNSQGRILANGVYLYVVTVKGWDGTELKSEIHKLVVLR